MKHNFPRRFHGNRHNFFQGAARASARAAVLGAILALGACAYRQPAYGPTYSAPPANGVYHAVPNSQVGCTNGIMSDPNVDAVIGGALGGLAGNQFGAGTGKQAMTALGAVAGALAGHKVGSAYGPC